MLTFVIYDIPDDKVRNKVADVCLDYGLLRIQLSAFRGFLTDTRRHELAYRLEDVLENVDGETQILTACKSDWANHLRVTKEGTENVKYQPNWGSIMYVAGGED